VFAVRYELNLYMLCRRKWSSLVYILIALNYVTKFPCPVEAGYNTPRVVRGDKRNPVPEGITGPPCSWGIQIQGPGSASRRSDFVQ
jgi:hypothetical protein